MSKSTPSFDELFQEDVSFEVGEVTPTQSKEPEFEEEGSLSNEENIAGNANTQQEQVIEPEDEDTTIPSSQQTEDKTSGSFALAFAEFQRDEGIISDFDAEALAKAEEEEGEVGALRYLLNRQAEAIRAEAQSIYAEDKEEITEYFRLKDLGVDTETAKELAYGKKRWEQASDDDLELDIDFRREVLVEHFKATTKFGEARIERMVDALFNSGEDLEEASHALKDLKRINEEKRVQAEQAVKAQEKAYKEGIKSAREDFKNSVMETEEYIKGLKVTTRQKNQIINMVLEPAGKDGQGNPINGIWAERAKDPKKFDALLAYHLINGTFYGDMKSIKSKIKTDVTSEFEERLRSRGDTITGRTKKSPKVDTSVIDQFLNS